MISYFVSCCEWCHVLLDTAGQTRRLGYRTTKWDRPCWTFLPLPTHIILFDELWYKSSLNQTVLTRHLANDDVCTLRQVLLYWKTRVFIGAASDPANQVLVQYICRGILAPVCCSTLSQKTRQPRKDTSTFFLFMKNGDILFAFLVIIGGNLQTS